MSNVNPLQGDPVERCKLSVKCALDRRTGILRFGILFGCATSMKACV